MFKWKKSSEKVEFNEGCQNELHLYVSTLRLKIIHISYDVSLLKNTRGTYTELFVQKICRSKENFYK